MRVQQIKNVEGQLSGSRKGFEDFRELKALGGVGGKPQAEPARAETLELLTGSSLLP